MSNGKEYTEFELHASGELRALKEIVNSLREELRNVCDKLGDYSSENNRQHERVWSKVDGHGRVIHRIIGGLIAITTLFGLDKVVNWLK